MRIGIIAAAFAALIAAAVGSGPTSAQTPAGGANTHHIEKQSNMRLVGDEISRHAGLSFQACEMRCLANGDCIALELFRGGDRPTGGRSTCRLFRTVRETRASRHADCGWKRPGPGAISPSIPPVAEAKRPPEPKALRKSQAPQQPAEALAAQQKAEAERRQAEDAARMRQLEDLQRQRQAAQSQIPQRRSADARPSDDAAARSPGAPGQPRAEDRAEPPTRNGSSAKKKSAGPSSAAREAPAVEAPPPLAPRASVTPPPLQPAPPAKSAEAPLPPPPWAGRQPPAMDAPTPYGGSSGGASPPAADAPRGAAPRPRLTPPGQPPIASEPVPTAEPPVASADRPPQPALPRTRSMAPLPPIASAPPPPPAPPAAAPAPIPAPAAASSDWDVVPVFYGTDRARLDKPARIAYSTERARRLELGRALVTVPKIHQTPTLERPWAVTIPFINVTLYEAAEDPKRHFTIQELRTLSRDEALALIRARLKDSQTFKGQALVFIHGYNNAFDDALYRTAQIAYDLKFDGASFLYSWPSANGMFSYPYDRESAQGAEPYLSAFLQMVVSETGASSISIIAHSMGNQPLLQVLRDIKRSNPDAPKIDQIILAAPDVDRDTFEFLSTQIRGVGKGITMYASSNDVALVMSRRFAGGVPRAGDVPIDLGPAVMAGIDTIDISALSTDYLALNHSTYAEKTALLDDIRIVLTSGMRPPERRLPILQKISSEKGDFWRYPR